jgi:hypothetical protein
MNPLLRGLCEQQIDEKIFGEELLCITDLVNELELPSSSKEDLAIGVFLGTMLYELRKQCFKMYKRPPKVDEVEDYHLILKRRTPEIKEKIMELNTLKKIENISDIIKKTEKNPEEYGDTKHGLNRMYENILGLYDLERSNDNGIRARPEVQIDFNARSKFKRRRHILGIPIPTRSK